MSASPDVIVIGLGAVGAATLYQLARRGVRALGIDRFAPPHSEGSSHGETRITRQAIGEGEIYVPLAIRSHAIWRELEMETGRRLLLTCGFVAIDGTGGRAVMHGKTGFAARTIAAADRYGIEHEALTPDELTYRHPAFRPLGNEQVYYEPGGGLVFPERCIAAQLDRAVELGATIRLNEPVVDIKAHANGMTVRTISAEYRSGHAVMAAGGWAPGLVGAPLGEVQLLRQTLHWIRPERPSLFAAGRFPTFIWSHGRRPEDSFYGFPLVQGATPGVKLATEQFSSETARPDAIERTVGDEETAMLLRTHARHRLNGLSDVPLRSSACFYTNSPDGDFAIGPSPEMNRLLVVSACSGHGFKHSAGVGEHVAKTIQGEESLEPAFCIGRPALSKAD